MARAQDASASPALYVFFFFFLFFFLTNYLFHEIPQRRQTTTTITITTTAITTHPNLSTASNDASNMRNTGPNDAFKSPPLDSHHDNSNVNTPRTPSGTINKEQRGVKMHLRLHAFMFSSFFFFFFS